MKSSHLSQEFLDQFVQVNSSNSGERKHRDAGAVMPFVGLTRADLSRSCCKNGGTCFLGSFCICPPFFTGRNCDYDTRIRRCDFIPHGEWVQKGCSYCRCMYGVLHCVPHVFHKDCGKDGCAPVQHAPFVFNRVVCDRSLQEHTQLQQDVVFFAAEGGLGRR
uniref:Teratocarcinoma-derived growth factor 1 n=1 Tax=Nothobranchius furzeri TaxID=105023 RepID=A0A8C6KPG4_NOTFU